MPCAAPLKGWIAREPGTSGKYQVVFNKDNAQLDRPAEVPCGQCIQCRLERVRQWAIRCMHEASMHEHNCFVTLTYDEDNLPENYGLTKGQKGDFTKFMKRLRQRAARHPLPGTENGGTIRYFQCGEYGEKKGRPHHHAILFGVNFPDLAPTDEKKDYTLYSSEILQGLWRNGIATVGEVTFDSAAYVAGYALKKIKTANEKETYKSFNPDTGLVETINAPYSTMSLKPAIGKDWYNKYKSDCFPSDSIVIRGIEMQPPNYYMKLLEEEDITTYNEIKTNRTREAKNNKDNNSRRRIAKEQITKAKLQLKRSTL